MLKIPTNRIIGFVFAWLTFACSLETYNPGDPGSREFLELRLLECLVDPNCPALVPVPVLGIGTGSRHTMLSLTDGRVRAWGDNTDGMLGLNNTISVADGSGPSIIAAGDVSVGGTVATLTTGTDHTCALLVSGTVRCWGLGTSGRLGYNATTKIGDGGGQTIIAAGDVPIGGTAVKLASANNHTCALLDSGNVRCWGANGNGNLGYGNTTPVGDGGTSIIAAGDVPIGGTVTDLAAGGGSSCAVLSGGSLRCWGLNTNGQLGYGTTTNVGNGGGPSITAAGDVQVGGTVIQAAFGGAYVCALLSGGTVRCWGLNTNGQLGYNNTTQVGDGSGPSIIAAGDVPVGGTVTQISTSFNHTCALLDTGAVRCWGANGSGQLGYNTTTPVGDGSGPSIIAAGDVPLGGIARQVITGDGYSCAVMDNASVRCWGNGDNGRTGYNSTAKVGDGAGLSIIDTGNVPYQ